MKLTIVELHVAEWERSVTWYREVLGLVQQLNVVADRYALLNAPPIHVAIKGDAAAAAQPASASASRLLFEVSNVEAELARLQSLKVRIVKPLEASSEGYRRIVIQDPDGNSIVLYDWAA